MKEFEQYLANNRPVVSAGVRRSEMAYACIKDALRHVEMAPGAPLSENRLSKSLGISRTPVREALQKLAEEGLVEIIPGRAVTVPAPAFDDMLNIVQMRSLLEPEMAAMAARAATTSQQQKLLACVESMEKAVATSDSESWSVADAEYHDLMRACCPNKLMGDTVVQLKNRVHHLSSGEAKANPERFAECTREHKEVAEAIANGDSKAAFASMKKHISALRASLLEQIHHR